jgi:crossover junction endodeoxyribonuclease RusA
MPAAPGDSALSFPHRPADAVATLNFVLPFPPSVNRYYRHVGYRTLLSREGRQYRAAVCRLLAGRVQQPLSVPLQAELHLYPPDRRRRDWDNFQKGVWDALQHAGIYLDDSQVRRAVVEMHEPDGKARAECQLQPRLPPDPSATARTAALPVSATRSAPGCGGAARCSSTGPNSCGPARGSTTG